jgi:deoxyribonuclease IV
MRIGAHVPVGDGLLRACTYATEVGCECIQIFAKSPRMWRGPGRDPDEAAAFIAERRRLGIGPVFVHAAYLINLGSSDPLLWDRSIAALADELRRADLVGAEAVIVHAGTVYDGAHSSPVGRVSEGVARAWESSGVGEAGPRIALENSAGAGHAFGSHLDELCEAAASARASGARTGICFDSCHGFAAGIDVSEADGWSQLCDAVHAGLGPGGLLAIHANDCKGELGAHKDRHAWIGDGHVGLDGFAAMFAEPRLAEVAVVVEMPGEPPEKDRENVGRLRTLRDAAAAAACRSPESA